MKRIAFFDTKQYDKESFDRLNNGRYELCYFETRLTAKALPLVEGCDGVCAFVNAEIDRTVVEGLVERGIRILALRCAGYNNVDFEAAFEKGLTVVRVPAYSPYAVAEHAAALLLTLNRHIHKAASRTRDFNFSLVGLTGFDLHGKTAGIIGTGKIGSVFANICKGFGMKVLVMSLKQVSFPREMIADRPPRLYMYQQAVWVLYIAAMGTGLATGILAWKTRRLENVQEETTEKNAVQSAVEALAAHAVAGETVTVKADYKDVTIPLAAIQYIEARNNYACLHLDHQEDVVSQITMKALLEMLPEGKFVRIHRSYIIPVHRIESKKATSVKLVGVDTPLPVGRAHKENLK